MTRLIFVGLFFLFGWLLNALFLRQLFGRWQPFTIWLSAILAFLPILYRLLDRWGIDIYPFSWLILAWLGWVTLIVFTNAFLQLGAWLLKKFVTLPENYIKWLKWARLGMIILICLWSILEPMWLKIYHFEWQDPKIRSPIRILHLSDWHLNQVLRQKRAPAITQLIQTLKPDLIVTTGDMIDGNLTPFPEWVQDWTNWVAPLGKLAILGNHEYYHNVDQAIEFLEKSGFQVLVDEVINVREDLTILGLNDSEGRYFKPLIDPKHLVGNLSSDRFRIILKHKPLLPDEFKGKFDLALCGHTHGGVFFPIQWIQDQIFIGHGGLYSWGDGYVFISQGIGTGGPPMRLGAIADVSVWDLKPGQTRYLKKQTPQVQFLGWIF